MIEHAVNTYYLSAPNIQPFKNTAGQWRWMNVGTFVVNIEMGSTSLLIRVPDGFTTDGASIPRWAQALFNPFDPATITAALVHDWLTPTDEEIAADVDSYSRRPVFPQTIAAGVFYELMRATDVPMIRRRVYYYAVVAAIKRRFW